MDRSLLNRRQFLGASSAALVLGASSELWALDVPHPVGLELFSVRDHFMEDEEGTVRLVAQMGYEVVEFWAPYFDWTAAEAESMKALMDDLGIECRSTHNNANYFDAENLDKAIELNQILGSKNLILASAGRVEGADGWRALAGKLTGVSERLKPLGMAAGFHNHQFEWRALPDANGQRIMDILAKNTPKEFVLQLDVGTCVEAGADPVAWIQANPGRIKSVHCKDWGAPVMETTARIAAIASCSAKAMCRGRRFSRRSSRSAASSIT